MCVIPKIMGPLKVYDETSYLLYAAMKSKQADFSLGRGPIIGVQSALNVLCFALDRCIFNIA